MMSWLIGYVYASVVMAGFSLLPTFFDEPPPGYLALCREMPASAYPFVWHELACRGWVNVNVNVECYPDYADQCIHGTIYVSWCRAAGRPLVYPFDPSGSRP